MSAQKLLLNTLGVDAVLKDVLSTMYFDEIFTKGVHVTSHELEEFVSEQKPLLINMILDPNKSVEDSERLTDALILLSHLKKQLDPHLTGGRHHVPSTQETERRDADQFVDVERVEEDSHVLPIHETEEHDEDDDGKKRNPKCESCKIYWHTIDTKNGLKKLPRVVGESDCMLEQGLDSLYLIFVSGHKNVCRFHVKKNPEMVMTSPLLLCLNSKRHIMSRQIKYRRFSVQHVNRLTGHFEDYLNTKNHKYMQKRNQIKLELQNNPQKWVEILTATHAFLIFVLLVIHRDKAKAAKKKTTPGRQGKVKERTPSPPVPGHHLLPVDWTQRQAIPVRVKNEEIPIPRLVQRNSRKRKHDAGTFTPGQQFVSPNHTQAKRGHETVTDRNARKRTGTERPDMKSEAATNTHPLDLSVRTIRQQDEALAPNACPFSMDHILKQQPVHDPRMLYNWQMQMQMLRYSMQMQMLPPLPPVDFMRWMSQFADQSLPQTRMMTDVNRMQAHHT